MKIRANEDWNLGQEEIHHFRKGEVYEVSDALGARLLKNWGPESGLAFQGDGPIFEEVSDRHKAAATVRVGGQPESGDGGEVDHAHLSDSELQHTDKDAEKRVVGTDRVVKDQKDAEAKK